MTIGQSIRKCRRDRDIPQHKLAETIGCAQCQLSQWENEKTFPSILYCIEIADALGVTLDELVGRKVNNECSV